MMSEHLIQAMTKFAAIAFNTDNTDIEINMEAVASDGSSTAVGQPERNV